MTIKHIGGNSVVYQAIQAKLTWMLILKFCFGQYNAEVAVKCYPSNPILAKWHVVDSVSQKSQNIPSCGCFLNQHLRQWNLSDGLIYEFVDLASGQTHLYLRERKEWKILVTLDTKLTNVGCPSVPWILMSAMLQFCSHTKMLKAPSDIVTSKLMMLSSAGNGMVAEGRWEVTT